MIVVSPPNVPNLEPPAPKAPAQARGKEFSSMLSQPADLSDATTTLAFSETGVFGRPPTGAEADRRKPASLLTTKPLPDQHTPSAPIAPATGAAPGAASAEPPNKTTSGTAVLCSQTRPAPRPPQSANVAAVHIAAVTAETPILSEAPPTSMATTRVLLRSASPLAAVRANAVNVAFHEIGRAANVIARVGRMTPTERSRMRQAIAQLLARHGFYDANISLTE